jgi:hypothetical protein
VHSIEGLAIADLVDAMVIPDGHIDDVLAGARAVSDEDAGYLDEISRERLPGSEPGAG